MSFVKCDIAIQILLNCKSILEALSIGIDCLSILVDVLLLFQVSNGTLGRPFRKYSVSTACIKSGKPEFVLRLAGKGENRNLINR